MLISQSKCRSEDEGCVHLETVVSWTSGVLDPGVDAIGEELAAPAADLILIGSRTVLPLTWLHVYEACNHESMSFSARTTEHD